MANQKKFDREFDRLLDTVKILKSHYSKIAGQVEADLIRLRFDKKFNEFDKLNKVRKEMRKDYDASLELIANKITHIDELQKTRRALRSAADKAFKFVDEMRKVKKTLDEFTKAAKFLSGLLGTLKMFLV